MNTHSPEVTHESTAGPETAHANLTEILELDPQIAQALSIADLCRTLHADLVNGRLLLTSQARQAMFLEPAVHHFNQAMADGLHVREGARIALHMGEEWLEYALRVAQGTEHDTAKHVTTHVLRCAIDDTQPWALNFMLDKGLIHADEIAHATKPRDVLKSPYFVDTIRQSTYTRKWESAKAGELMEAMWKIHTKHLLSGNELKKWLQTEATIVCMQGGSDTRGSSNYIALCDRADRTAAFLRAIQSSPGMVRSFLSPENGKKPLSIIVEGTRGCWVAKNMLDTLMQIHENEGTANQILPEPHGAWMQIIGQFFDSQTSAMKTLRQHENWRSLQMDQLERDFRNFLIRRGVDAHRGRSAQDAKAIERHPEHGNGTATIRRIPGT